jgi:hypothetical protein
MTTSDRPFSTIESAREYLSILNGDEVSGWQAAWNRFNPNCKKRSYRRSILLVLKRLIQFACISPDVARFKRNDFHAAVDLADAGYRAARGALTKWLAEGAGEFGLRRPDLFGR